MSEVIQVSPFRCRMWDGHARLEEHINEETCQAEIASFLSHGQQMPVLGRPLSGRDGHDYELIYGARRLFVARHLNVPLLMTPRELSDREATVALDIENRQRKELSPYERGLGYIGWLRSGVFSSQEDLARTVNVSASQVSRLIRMAQLPPVILNAFGTPLEICENWGRQIMDLLDDPQARPAVTSAARAIAKESPRPPAAAVYRRLLAAPGETRSRAEILRAESHDEVVKDQDGCPLFRIRCQRHDTALLLPTSSVPYKVLLEIKEEVREILHRSRVQPIDFTAIRAIRMAEVAVNAEA